VLASQAARNAEAGCIFILGAVNVRTWFFLLAPPGFYLFQAALGCHETVRYAMAGRIPLAMIQPSSLSTKIVYCRHPGQVTSKSCKAVAFGSHIQHGNCR
jgi:hypothetical protein